MSVRFHLLRIRPGQVDLVDDRQDLQVVVQGQVGVAQGLGLDALACVHHQQRPLAGGQAAADLIVEVHVARRVDKVQPVFFPVCVPVFQTDGPGLDGDAPLLLQVHVVQDLGLHVSGTHRVAGLQQPVGQGALAVVDVGDDGKIAYLRLVDHGA